MKKTTVFALALLLSLCTGLLGLYAYGDDEHEEHHDIENNHNNENTGNHDENGGSTSTGQYSVIATNDLGMHCTVPGADTFIVLPPFNTLRAQVFQKGEEPRVITDKKRIKVEYSILENTDTTLKTDPYFQNWIENGPKLFPGFSFLRQDGRIQGLTGATLSGEMEPKDGYWVAEGIPAFPALDPNGVLQDPLGGPNRNPYLTGVVKVVDANTGQVLTETTTTVPVAFGGCNGCHLDVAQDYGYPRTPRGSFEVMGLLHQQNSSGIDISKIDPDGDGKGGPIRCSRCHLDPAMGESTPPGYAGYPISSLTFSEVVHTFHAQSTAVTAYDPDIVRNCYNCHPGNNENCYRGQHRGHGLWCTDCHGDLNQRIAQGQLKKPWSHTTLPSCSNCHDNVGEGRGWIGLGIFGTYLNSRGHKNNKVLCSTCHGQPHALYPSMLAADNTQMLNLQSNPAPLGACQVCHTDRTGWGRPPHTQEKD